MLEALDQGTGNGIIIENENRDHDMMDIFCGFRLNKPEPVPCKCAVPKPIKKPIDDFDRIEE